MNYIPGLHILAEIYTDKTDLLSDYSFAKDFFNEKVIFYNLNKVGEVFHNFPEGGYTGVVCLTESHLAVHTWPEYGMLTLDIYLSNNKKQNDQKARDLFEEIVRFYDSHSCSKKEVIR